MAKLILEFDYHEEREEYEAALNASKLLVALYDIQQLLRRHDKYESFKDIDAMADAIRDVIEENEL